MMEPSDTVKGNLDKAGPTYRDYVTVALEEYKALRDESKQCGINILNCFSFGLAAIAVLSSGRFAVWDKNPIFSLVVFYGFIPIVIAFSTLIWLGEAFRFDRVGKYLCFIEIKLSLLIRPAFAAFLR